MNGTDNDIHKRNSPVVSVLMTSFNRERYISQAIESVLTSTFQDFELIIADDVSSDSTVSIAEGYANEDKRIKVFRNKINLGDYSNRNYAASMAKGRYIKFVDSDDTIAPDALRIMVTMMEENPDCGWGISIKHTKGIEELPVVLKPRESYLMHYTRNPIFFASPGEVIFKRKVFNSSGGFKPLRMVGDFEMWHRLAEVSPVLLLPPGLYQYRKHGDQEIRQFAQYLVKYEEIKVNFLLAENSHLSKKEAKRIIRERMKTLVKIIAGFIVKSDFRAAGYRMRVLSFYLKNFLRFV